MIDIRPIRADEAEEFLTLLCEVFDLDYARARSIFFSEPLFDLDRKWALFESGKIVSILTTVALQFGWGRAIGIAGVATAMDRQREGLGAKLLEHVLAESQKAGETGAMLFAHDTRLYTRCGFEVLDQVIRGPIVSTPETDIPSGMDLYQVQNVYNAWAEANPNRLRRDELRWKYWMWNLRICSPFHDGYLCFEAGVVRELVVSGPPPSWVLPLDSEWLGLASMAANVSAEISPVTVELQLMGRNIPAMPQFFMTDQF